MKTLKEAKLYIEPISTVDVYGTATPKAPEGWEFTGEFRPPGFQENYLRRAKDISEFGGILVGLAPAPMPGARLILKKIEPKKVEQIGKSYLFRFLRRGYFANEGEWTSSVENCYWTSYLQTTKFAREVDIYERVEI